MTPHAILARYVGAILLLALGLAIGLILWPPREQARSGDEGQVATQGV
jgi:hypothetical protein